MIVVAVNFDFPMFDDNFKPFPICSFLQFISLLLQLGYIV